MAANKAPIMFTLLLLLLASKAYADSGVENNSRAIIEYAKKEVITKTSELGKRIAFCDNQRDSTAIPDVNYDELKKIGVSRQQVIKALAHLSSRNYAMCEEGTREALAYALGALSMLSDQYDINNESIQGIEELLIYPTSRDIELAMEFSELNNDIKARLIHAVGDRPFDLIRTLKKNGLSYE